MPMTFEEAETRFRQLQARVQRGESISRAEYEEEVGKLAVQDRNGTLWEINPRTGKWMYFDGAEWVSGAPPGHDTSTVIPVPKEIAATREASPAPSPASPAPPPSPAPPLTRPVAPSPPTPPSRAAPPPRPTPPPTEPAPFVRTEPKSQPPARQKAPAAPPPSTTPGARPTRPALLGGHDHEWVPLAIGAAVLFVCFVISVIAANVVLPLLSSKPAPTRTTIAALATSTRVPTPMLLPSPTPIPPTPVPVTAKVTATTLNIRADASSKAKSMGTLKKDNQVTFLAQTKGEKIEGQDTWYLINLPNSTQQGWVFFGKNFQILSGDPTTLPTSGAATPTPTKGTGAPVAPVGATATPTVIGVIPPTPKAYP